MKNRNFTWFLSLIALTIVSAEVNIRAAEAKAEPIVPEYGLLLTRTGQSADRSSRRFSYFQFDDPVHSKLVDGTLSQFEPGEDEAVGDDNRLKWKRVEFNDSGAIEERGLYLYAPVESDKRCVAVLDSGSHGEMYVNGAPRAANIYSRNYFHVPVLLNRGTNHLLLRSGRGSFKVRLYDPPAPVFLNKTDVTLPDLVADRPFNTWGAIVVINATTEWTRGIALAIKAPGLTTVETPVPPVGPLSIRKVRFRIRGSAPDGEAPVAATLELRGRKGKLSHSIPIELKVVQPDRQRNITFVSKIDGSVQYFSLKPATSSSNDPRPAIVLSCHGAAVKAHRQAGSYSSKDWFHIVAPTNRRPFGYDWEDFGRMDAMEVLDIVKKSQRHDPSRIYVTGHSMGGHGAWHLGVTYPDKFAAVGPSAGWLSRSTYGRRRSEQGAESPMESILRRPRKAGDTVALAANLKQHGVYILHGANDDNVPASQARRMSEVLDEFHNDWFYHAEPGKKHWWSNEYGDGGAACLDWPFMFDMFARHALPPSAAVREVEFVTANPGVSSTCHWLAIEGQIGHHDISKAHIHTWPAKRIFKGTTENVAVLRLDVGHLRSQEPITVDLDGQEIAEIPYPEEAGALWLGRKDGTWRLIEKPPAEHKGPHRYGSIKDELKHRFL
ncbi:MAG: carboxylesterase family protein, partial [Planctomycetota bacterium]